MFAQFVNVLYSIVDRIYVGNIPVTGADALAGVGVCAPIVTLLSSFGALFGIGGSVLFSVRLGAGDEKNARKVLANSFVLLIIASLALTLLFLITKGWLLNWFGASEVTFSYADTYLTIYTAGTFFALPDDLYGGHLFCAPLHGDELFHHGTGIPAPRDGDNPDRRGY